MKQVHGIDAEVWRHTGSNAYLWACVALMLVNTSLESYKWYILSNAVEPIKYRKALSSYLAGVAFSIITPNRVGEYPGRVLYLGRRGAARYVRVSVPGIMSQLWSVYLFGFAGLVYYNLAFPDTLAKSGLAFCIIVNIFFAVIYWRLEAWLPAMERITWLRRFFTYGKLLNKVSARMQFLILSISLCRFAIFTAQYLFLLTWMNVNMPLLEGFCMCTLFFWIMAVIPSIALTELGVRGAVSIFLFHHFSTNTVGMVAATAGIWLFNLIIPSVLGSLLILRMRLLQ
jgi:hypothetical protein